MRIITRKRLRQFAGRFADAAGALQSWEEVVNRARWASIDEVREIYPHADAVEVESGRTATIFNMRGNRYRLIVAIHYNRQRVYVMRFLTHAEYDKDQWKEQL
jgi:mRNA interferase HigB